MWLILPTLGSAFACAISWFALARWLHVSRFIRLTVAGASPLAIGGLLLWADGSLYNGVYFVFLFVPFIVVNMLVLIALEHSFAPAN